MQAVQDGRINNEIGLGINVFSSDWTRLARVLKRKSSHIVAGDFSNFDGSLNRQLLCKLADIVSDWYDDGEENRRIRRVLMEYLVSSVWAVQGVIVQLDHSQPSGNYITTLLNCMYNMLIFRYVYLLARRKNGMTESLLKYREHVTGVFYGDDSIMAISEEAIEWFNQVIISELMEKTGHSYTDETKSAVVRKAKTLDEVTFLKRSFKKFSSETWIGPLARETVEDMVMWSTTSQDLEEALHDVVQNASIEAWAHGREYFDTWTEKVKAAVAEVEQEYSGVGYRDGQQLWISFVNGTDVATGYKMKDLTKTLR